MRKRVNGKADHIEIVKGWEANWKTKWAQKEKKKEPNGEGRTKITEPLGVGGGARPNQEKSLGGGRQMIIRVRGPEEWWNLLEEGWGRNGDQGNLPW